MNPLNQAESTSQGAEIYLRQIHAVLPRILAWFDTDPSSPTRGCGDRRYWSWKLIDFPNGTYQGVANGLARLLVAGLLPDWLPTTAALQRIDACFVGAAAIRRTNGSWEEAFPFESSFCVTALVASDLLISVDLLQTRIDVATRERWLAVVRPAIAFLQRADEHHAFISNHLATAAVALARWTALTGEPGAERGRMFWERIREAQSAEGWFREYEGADPGYQSLCAVHLADLQCLRPDWGVAEPLARSFGFLAHCVHPDGSFGGIYGSRNTRFWFPAGAEVLGSSCQAAAGLAIRLRQSIERRAVVSLDTMDDPNLAPLFNAYCWAATCSCASSHGQPEPLPCDRQEPFRRTFPEAGLVIDNGPGHYRIVSWHKGGVTCHCRKDGTPIQVDGGAIGELAGRICSTQSCNPANRQESTADALIVTARFTTMHRETLGPWQMIVLRLLNVTVMRWLTAGNLVKRLLVRRMITGRKDTGVVNRRSISWGPDLRIVDEVIAGADPRWRLLAQGGAFSAIHMASQGYWQGQDDQQVATGREPEPIIPDGTRRI